MNMQAQRDISRKLKVFAHAAGSGNVAFTCRHFGISREIYYQWKRAYAAHGEKGLINSKPCPENPKLRTPLPIEEKILYLRRNCHFGQVRISWYLARYHDIKISSGGVYKVLKRHDLNRLPDRQRKRSIATIQYTAIDDATRIRALKIYERHTQLSLTPARRCGYRGSGRASGEAQVTPSPHIVPALLLIHSIQ
jgi:transposase-like protein